MSGETRYLAEKYSPASWLIRERKSGRIVSYPGPKLASVAACWLKWEAAENGQRVGDLAEFSAVVNSAAGRIIAALEKV